MNNLVNYYKIYQNQQTTHTKNTKQRIKTTPNNTQKQHETRHKNDAKQRTKMTRINA